MGKEEVLTDVPETAIENLRKSFQSEGADVVEQHRQEDGRWTVVAKFFDHRSWKSRAWRK